MAGSSSCSPVDRSNEDEAFAAELDEFGAHWNASDAAAALAQFLSGQR
jgi:hypothetical protein